LTTVTVAKITSKLFHQDTFPVSFIVVRLAHHDAPALSGFGSSATSVCPVSLGGGVLAPKSIPMDSLGGVARTLGSKAGATATAVPVGEALVEFGAITPAPHFTQNCESSGIFVPHLRQNISNLLGTYVPVLLGVVVVTSLRM